MVRHKKVCISIPAVLAQEVDDFVKRTKSSKSGNYALGVSLVLKNHGRLSPMVKECVGEHVAERLERLETQLAITRAIARSLCSEVKTASSLTEAVTAAEEAAEQLGG